MAAIHRICGIVCNAAVIGVKLRKDQCRGYGIGIGSKAGGATVVEDLSVGLVRGGHKDIGAVKGDLPLGNTGIPAQLLVAGGTKELALCRCQGPGICLSAQSQDHSILRHRLDHTVILGESGVTLSQVGILHRSGYGTVLCRCKNQLNTATEYRSIGHKDPISGTYTVRVGIQCKEVHITGKGVSTACAIVRRLVGGIFHSLCDPADKAVALGSIGSGKGDILSCIVGDGSHTRCIKCSSNNLLRCKIDADRTIGCGTDSEHIAVLLYFCIAGQEGIALHIVALCRCSGDPSAADAHSAPSSVVGACGNGVGGRSQR